MKKKIVSILLCVTMVAAMAVGCGSKDGGSDSKSESGDSKDKKYKVGITIQSLSNAYWAGVMGKLEEQLKDKGWDYTLIDCEDNSATQVSQIENFITSGCDLIMVHPSDAKAVENFMLRKHLMLLITINISRTIRQRLLLQEMNISQKKDLSSANTLKYISMMSMTRQRLLLMRHPLFLYFSLMAQELLKLMIMKRLWSLKQVTVSL